MTSHTSVVERARRHRRISAALAFGLLALIVELVGRSLTHRIDLGRHVAPPRYNHADYYPILMAVVKLGCALVLTRLAWRVVRARRAVRLRGGPRLRLELSPRLWAASFAVTSLIYLVQMDAEGAAAGRWPLLGPWLHSSALPVFSLLSILFALVYGAVTRWLAELERVAAELVARVPRPVALALPRARSEATPRALFGLAFESRPPPAPA